MFLITRCVVITSTQAIFYYSRHNYCHHRRFVTIWTFIAILDIQRHSIMSKLFRCTPLLGHLRISYTFITKQLGCVGTHLHGRLCVSNALHQPKNPFVTFYCRRITLLSWHVVSGTGVITTIASYCSLGMLCRSMSCCGFCLQRRHLSPSDYSTKSDKSPKRRFADHRSCRYKVRA